MSLNEVSIKIPGEYIPNVFGQFDAFAKKIERTLHVTLVLRDDSLKIIGAQGNIDGAKEVFEQLIALAETSMPNLSDTVLREMHITLLLRQKTEAEQPKQWNLQWKKLVFSHLR